MEVIKVCPTELELSEIHTNVKCSELGCTSVFPNTSSLEMHLIKTHSKDSSFLNKKEGSLVYQYYCPVESCKYEMHKDRSIMQLRWFTKLKYLKQHYIQVHKERKFKCSKCNKSFLTEKEKNNHCNTECGVKFTCIACNAMYNTQVAFGKHCKRKHHLNVTPAKRVKQVTSGNKQLIGSLKRECPILPKPVNNPIENIAAAALSELSWKIVVRGVDKEVQTEKSGRRRTPIRSLKKRDSQETQTGDKRPRVSQETQTTSSYKNKRAVEGEGIGRLGIQTQTFHDLFPELADPLPQLYSAGTQTGDRPFFDVKKELGLDIFEDQHSQRSYSDQIDRLIQSSLLDSARSCNIQTQTELELNESFIEPILSNTETQTIQNAIDEYSHNYTQTCDDIFLNDFVEFTDIETQTAWANLDLETGLVSAETQTSI